MKDVIKRLFKIVSTIMIFLSVIVAVIEIVNNKKNTESLHKPYGIYEKYFKRFFDFVCGMSALFAFWWLYLIIAILVRAKLGKPIFFTQERPGKDGKIFKMYKFRTMTDERNAEGELLSDELRLTQFGKWLRSTSMDELPEALNIIKGDMSVVGPRPLAVQYLPYYTEDERHRHDVRPGLSGLAQVHGRNSIIWEEKFAFDTDYVKKITFWGDLKIIFLSVITILKREGIGTRGVDVAVDFDKYRKSQLEKGENSL